jgi:hypothetical protein
MPARIGRYHVVRRLGAGAFATVWLAHDEELESAVAIKVLAENWSHHSDVRARFEQEAQILRRTDSERLVRVHDFGELPDGRPYQVMTYAAGGTLAERLAEGRMPVDVAVRTAVAIAHAVTVLHDSGILHRDLKPSNVLFDTIRGEQRVLVADLGLAKEIAHASGFTMVAGTPGYMAPEQSLPGSGLDVRADVHALGAMTYQMLTGQTPRTGVAPSKLRPAVPRQVDRVVLRALDTDRARRWPTAAAFASALDSAATPARARRRAVVLRGARRLAGATAAVVALAAAGGATVPQATTAGWVRVSDAAAVLSVAVPAEWGVQVADSGWDPTVIGLPAGRAPGLLVGADLTTWADPASPAPGVFAGAIDGSPVRVRFPAHESCTRRPSRTVVTAGLSGEVSRWTECGGTAVSYSEVLLTSPRGPGVYLQIKQVTGTDRTDQVLNALRLPHR